MGGDLKTSIGSASDTVDLHPPVRGYPPFRIFEPPGGSRPSPLTRSSYGPRPHASPRGRVAWSPRVDAGGVGSLRTAHSRGGRSLGVGGGQLIY